MAQNLDFNIGKDVKVVLQLGILGEITFSHVTGWQADPITKEVMVPRLNGSPLAVFLPGGWKGSYQIDRANSVADDAWATIETMYWAGQRIPRGTLYQYVSETSGTTSTYQFEAVAIKLGSAGRWDAEQVVKQTIDFFSGKRLRIS